MSSNMLQFVRLSAATPDKREVDERVLDFQEIFRRFTPKQAGEQSSRCEQCGIPFCQIHCPLSNNIPDWLMLAAAGRLEEAYRVSSATNSMPEICGRICPQDRLCEGSCVLEQSSHEAVTIGAVEKFITDTAWENGWVTAPKPAVERRQSIGIIGSGPAGLAAAEMLRGKGFQVHIYDRHDRAGGLLIYGIPSFKLEKQVVERRTKLLSDSGVVFHLNYAIGRDASIDDLRRRHAALLIATGVYQPRALSVPGAELKGVHKALDFLIANNRKGLGDPVGPELSAEGKRVVVIGGGDTAMDCVRTAVRQGARSVACLYRRDRANMPGSQREVKHAEEEGVRFVWQSAPEALNGDGSVSSVSAIKMHLGIADASGRQTPSPIDGSQFELEADMVISALGFDPEDLPTLFGTPDLTVTLWGTIKADPKSLMTSLPGVFAAGDIVRGASLVVWAIKDGRDAAQSIERYLEAKAPRPPADKTRPPAADQRSKQAAE
jgi:glutamate synthase (NADPH/NADH) small chain